MSKKYFQIIDQIVSNENEYDQNSKQILDLVEKNDDEVCSQLAERSLAILSDTKEQPIKKLLVLMLVKDCLEKKSQKLFSAILKNKFLEVIQFFAKHEKNNKDPDRGKTIFDPKGKKDPDLGIQFLQLVLECSKMWALKWPKDAKQNDTKFKLLYDNLIKEGVKFPDDYIYFDVQKTKTGASQPPPKQSQQQNQWDSQWKTPGGPDQANSVKDFKIKANKIMDEIIQTQEGFFDILNGNTELQDYLIEMLDQSIDNYKKDLGRLDQLINDQYSFENALNEQESAKLFELRDLVDLAQNSITSLKLVGYETSTYQDIRTNYIKKFIQIKPSAQQAVTKKPPPVQSQPQQSQSSFDNFDRFSKFQQSFNDMPPQPQKQNNQTKQSQQKPKEEFKDDFQNFSRNDNISQHARQNTDGNQSNQSNSFNKQQQQLVTNPYSFQATNKDNDKINLGQSKFSTLFNDNSSQNQQINQSQNQPQNFNQQVLIKQTQSTINMNQSQINNQDNRNNQSQKMQASFGQQGFNNQPSQNNPNLTKQNVMQASYLSQLQANQKNPNMSANYQKTQFSNQMDDFDERFSMLSVSTMSVRDFPAKNLEIIDKKIYKGKLIPFDQSIFNSIEASKMPQSQLRRFKVGNLKSKCPLIDSQEFQLGVKSQSIFDYMSSKTYLKLDIFFGNKTNFQITDFKVDYYGDETCELYIRPDELPNTLKKKNQQKQEVIIQYKKCPYSLINAEIKGIVNNQHELKYICFLPTLLTKFMNFQECEPQVFRYKWRAKKDSIIKSDIFAINPKVIRQPTYFLRYFPKCLELSNLEQFVQQNINSGDLRYYKLGGIFELNVPNIEFMIKITVRPNLTAIIQMISFPSYIQTAELLMHHFVYIFSKPQ